MIKFNINEYVRVKLKPEGIKIIKDFYNHDIPGLKEYNPQVDAEGYTTFQLWSLMEIFGRHIYLGGNVPFETEILLDVK